MIEKQMKVRPALAGMEVGGRLAFPISDTKSIRVQASDLGLILERRYKTKTDRERRTIEVTRIK